MPPHEEDIKYEAFVKELSEVINRHSRENLSDTPDFILADFIAGCLNVYENTVKAKKEWLALQKV